MSVFDDNFTHLIKNNNALQTRLDEARDLNDKQKKILATLNFDTKAILKLENNEVLKFQALSSLAPEVQQNILACLEGLKPWRKGPFNIYSIAIDAEWRSDIKWNNLIRHISIEGKRILDIGANNGYYMFRALLENPRWVLGIDPTFEYFAQYYLLQQMLREPRLMFERLGHQDLPFFQKQFDLVLCLGIIYHTTDPVTLLKNIHQSLDKYGELILESQGIPSDENMVLIPRGKYAGAKGMWYVPSKTALTNWLKRAGFSQVEVFHWHKLSSDEQRTTKWADIPSFHNFIDSENPDKTVEGYPAPIRIYIKARK